MSKCKINEKGRILESENAHAKLQNSCQGIFGGLFSPVVPVCVTFH